MKNITALELSHYNLDIFESIISTHDQLSIEYWGQTMGIIYREDPDETFVSEITLPKLCRGSKTKLKNSLKYYKGRVTEGKKPVIKIISGQHDKKIVGYLVGV